MPADDHRIRGWLKMVGALNVGAMASEEFEWRLSVLAPALAAEFDAAVFTPDTARTVARQNVYFPTFGEICKALEPLAAASRESRRILALPDGRPESREPYDPGPAPAWCFERNTRHFDGRPDLNIQPPQRTVAEQLAALATPLRAAAASTHQETKRGPPIDA